VNADRKMPPLGVISAVVPAVGLLLASFAAPAQSLSPADVLQHQGILGTWAVACPAGPSTSNIFTTYYLTQKGEVRRRTDRGADGQLDGAIDAAKSLSNNRVRLRLRNDDQNWGRQNGATAEIVISVSRRKMQTMDAFGNDGTEIIREGHFVTGGAPSPTLERCSK
jgi:hypothetical protein